MTDEELPGRKLKRVASDELAEVRHYKGGPVDCVHDPLLPRTFQLRPRVTFWDDISRLAEECDDILQVGGLPPISHARGSPAPYENLQVFSEEWFAAKIGLKCFQILAGRETRSDFALENTRVLGELVNDRSWRRLHKADAVRGKKTLEAASRGGDLRGGKLGDDTVAIFDDMKRLLEVDNNISAAARRLAVKYNKEPAAIRAIFYRLRKKLLHIPPSATAVG